MARYEYRCPTCEERFDVERPMSAVATAVTCSAGHEARRVFTPVASLGARADSPSPAPVPAGGGGCCGGACGCN